MELNSTCKSIIVTSSINFLYILTEIKQFYTNDTENPIELLIKIPLKNDIILKSFRVKMGEKIIHSKIIEKEKANEKYNDDISSGLTSIIGNYSENNIYTIIIGNFLAGETLELLSEMIQPIKSEDKSYKFTFSPLNFPLIENRQIPSTARSVDITINAFIQSYSKITRLISRTHSLNTTFADDYKTVSITVTNSEIIAKDFADVEILFRTEDINRPKLYEEYDHLLNIYTYSFTLMLDNIDREVKVNVNSSYVDTDSQRNYLKDDINDAPGVFIFLIDQSVSMTGKSIEIAKESLKLFIRSLPTNSYFDIIGFGTNFKIYTKDPYFYNEENVKQSMNIIDAIRSNLKGTNIFEPLNAVFSRKYNKNLSKNVFLITDGKVLNPIDCLEIIKTNSNEFRIHAIGIGTDVDNDFINSCGINGKGTAQFAPEKNELRKLVINALNISLRPYYNNVTIELEDKEFESKIKMEYPKKTNSLLYLDEIYSYAFLSDTKLNPDQYIIFKAYEPIQGKYIENKLKIEDILNNFEINNCLNRMVVGMKLKEDNNDFTYEETVQMSMRYQVLSKATTLFSEQIDQNNYQNNSKNNNLLIQSLTYKNPKQITEYTNTSNTTSIDSSDNSIQASAIKPNDIIVINNKPCKVVHSNTSKTGKHGSAKILITGVDILTGKMYELAVPSSCTITRQVDVISNNVNSSNCVSNDILNASKRSELNLLISAQSVEGRWYYNSYVVANALNEYDHYTKDMELILKDVITDSELRLDLIATLIVVLYLQEKFEEFKDEYFLIRNKGLKFVKNNKIDYKEIFEKMNLIINF